MSNTNSPSFTDFSLSPDLLRALTEQGYQHPTPIQAQAIPVVLEGRDVMGAAQTGTGKTASFSLPLIQRLLPHANASASPARHPVRALILAPTRELADQVAENVTTYAKYTPLRVAVVFGGVDITPQRDALRRGVEILIATPGRLLDHVQQKNVVLSQVQMLVLDEADRMLDMGFMPDLVRILQLLPKQRQSLMFSATFSGEIRKLAESFLQNPVSIEVARRNATADTIEQSLYWLERTEQKRHAVAQLIRERQLTQVIVFSNTKIGAARLARELLRDGIQASAIHGDKSQTERLKTLEDFKEGQVVALVATDVAARGLDIAELPAVINFDLPYNAEDYVHRIGRTGRAGAQGLAISLATAADEKLLGAIEKLIKKPFTRHTLPGLSVAFSQTETMQRPPKAEQKRTENARGSAMRNPSRKAVDDWFNKPYEPASSVSQPSQAAPSVATVTSDVASGGARKKPQGMGALLGGLRVTSDKKNK